MTFMAGNTLLNAIEQLEQAMEERPEAEPCRPG